VGGGWGAGVGGWGGGVGVGGGFVRSVGGVVGLVVALFSIFAIFKVEPFRGGNSVVLGGGTPLGEVRGLPWRRAEVNGKKHVRN